MASHPPSSDNASLHAQGMLAPLRVAAPCKRVWQLVIMVVLVVYVLAFSYAGLSILLATQLVYVPQQPILKTPAALGLSYRNVSFPSREDHFMLQGWFIPGGLPSGQLTARRRS